MSSLSSSLWTWNNINELSPEFYYHDGWREKRKRRWPARNTFISTLQNVSVFPKLVYSPSSVSSSLSNHIHFYSNIDVFTQIMYYFQQLKPQPWQLTFIKCLLCVSQNFKYLLDGLSLSHFIASNAKLLSFPSRLLYSCYTSFLSVPRHLRLIAIAEAYWTPWLECSSLSCVYG